MYADSATPDITEALPPSSPSRTATATSGERGSSGTTIDGIGFQRKTGTDATIGVARFPFRSSRAIPPLILGSTALAGTGCAVSRPSTWDLASKYYEAGETTRTPSIGSPTPRGVDVWTAGEVKGPRRRPPLTLPGGVGELDHGEKSFLSGDICSAGDPCITSGPLGSPSVSAGTSWFDTPTVMPAGTVTEPLAACVGFGWRAHLHLGRNLLLGYLPLWTVDGLPVR